MYAPNSPSTQSALEGTDMDPKALRGRYAIVGVGEAGMGKAQAGDTALSLQCEAARKAILEAGLTPADIDGVFAHWDDRAAGLLVTEYMGLAPRYVDSTVVGGQSNLTHVAHGPQPLARRSGAGCAHAERTVRAPLRHAEPDRLLCDAGAPAHAPPWHPCGGSGRSRAGGKA